MKIWRWAGGIFLYGAFLVATAPASLLLWGINRLASVELGATHASGTLWRGTAHQFGLRQTGQTGTNLGDLSWELDFSRLTSGQQGLLLNLSGANASGQALAWISPSSIQIRDVQLSIPAEALSTFPRFAAWNPQGRLTLHCTSLAISRETLQGKAEIRWEQAALGISPVRPLGAWHVRLNADGQTTQIHMDTLNGPLALKGQGDWSRSEGLRFNGTASALDKQNELKPLLTLIGHPLPGQQASVGIRIK